MPVLGLCRGCNQAWPVRPSNHCATCGREIAAATDVDYRCGDCLDRRLPHRRMTVGWSYDGPVAASLRALKFQRLERIGVHLVDRMFEALPEDELTRLKGVEIVTAVPLWRWRLLRRGYNQAEILARRWAWCLDLPCVSLLARRKGSRPQTRLSREQRRRNVRSSMRWRGSSGVPKSVLLVDDVVTTGATLEEAARTLRRAGVELVHCLAIARTPNPD